MVHMNSTDRHFIVHRAAQIVAIREVPAGSCAFTLSKRDAWDRAQTEALPAKRSSDPTRRRPAQIVFTGLDMMSTVLQTEQATQAIWEQLNTPATGLSVAGGPEPTVVDATDAEERLLAAVDALRAQQPNEFRDSLLDQFDRKGTLSEKQIAAVERGVEKRKQWAAERADMPDVPAGRYAVENEEGILRFYRVDRPEAGKWAGYTFVKIMASDEEHPVRGTAAKAVLAKIAADPLAAMKRYGHEIGSCGKCGRTLTDPASIAAGIGPVCEAGL
jgi:hypothetical protein